MEASLGLDDCALFLAVADSGGAAAAARLARVPLPTLSRRMTEFERRAGQRLFLRGSRGYALTAAGRALAAEAGALRDVRARLDRWQAGEKARPRVRITAGLWTMRLIARRIAEVWSPDAAWVPELLATNAALDIARREADIGVRSVKADQPWLASRRIGPVPHAIYGTPGAPPGFVSLSDAVPTTPAERWLRATRPAEVITAASDARLALDLARAGVGRIVLPCFAGDGEGGLVRLSEPIAELAQDEWIVSHHEARHDPPIRAALDALTPFLIAAKR
jgi:DNA-binding transcriptional LysR family regulator